MRTKKIRTLVVLNLLALALLFVSWQPVSAQTTPAGLEMQAQAAFEGNFKYGEWLPIWATLENTGTDTDAVLQAQINQSGGNITFATRVSLPYSSRKQVVLYVLPNNFSREIEIQLVSEDTLLASQVVEVSPIQTDHYVVGIAAPEWGPLAQISSIHFERSPREIVLTDLALDQIPDQPASLNSFDVIILNDADTSAFSEAQQHSLENWVKNGGFLVIGGGAGTEKTASGLPESLANFEVQQLVETSDLQNLEQLGGGEEILLSGPFLVSQITRSSDGDSPAVLHQWPVGKGTVSLVSLSLTDAPFNAWSGTPEFWKNLLANDAYFPFWLPRDISQRQMRSNSMSYPLSNLPALDLPSIKNLGVLLIVYILVIGPVNYWTLKRRKKLHLAWVTIPVLTAVFAVGAFGLAYAMRGNDIVTNKLAIINLDQDGYAQINSYIGMFSPAQESYEIDISGSLLLSPTTSNYYDPWSSYNPGSTIGETVFMQGEPSKVVGLEINQWSMQSFMSENQTAYFGQIVSDLTLSGNQLTGSIENRMEQPLMDAAIVFGNSVISLGDLAPQESFAVEAAITEQSPEFYGGTLTYKILEAYYPNINFEYQREYELRRSILDATFQPFGFWIGPAFEGSAPAQGDNLSLPNVYLVGWVEEVPPEIQINGKRATQNALGMLTTHLPFQVASGEYALPTTLIEGRLTDQSSNNGYCGSTSTSIFLDYGSAEFEFQIPPAMLDTEIDELLVRFQEEASQWNGGQINTTLSIYDWDKDRWSGISNLANGINGIDDTDSYINQNGIIKIKLEKDVANSGGCLLVLVGLEGFKP